MKWNRGDKMKKLGIDMPDDLHRALKSKASLSGLSIKNYIIGLIERDLKKEYPVPSTKS